MKDGVVPISEDERKARIAKAQKLMAEQKLDAIFMEGTTSCFYYTGMRWGQSERTFGVIIPANGAIAYVCPGFEEDRVREQLKPAFGDEVRVWQEDESPYAVIAGIVKDRGTKHHRIGMEERVRFFIADGVHLAAPGYEIVCGDASDRRLPRDQVEGRDRAHAARERRHPRGVQGGPADAARGDAAGRAPATTS